MKFKDEVKLNKLKGIITFKKRNVVTGVTEIISEENVILTQSRTFMRDLLAGDDTGIIKIQVGDCNKELGDEADEQCTASEDDTELTNKFFDKDFDTRESITYNDGDEDYPAVKYTFIINSDEANDSNNDDNERKLWCEYGLGNNNGDIWNRKIKPIIKDDESEITIVWTIIF